MEGEAYTRAETEALGDEWPSRGPLCPHCNRRIPQFADLSESDARRVRGLICQRRPIMAVAELRAATGCSERWAELWVEHKGRPIPLLHEGPCPYCGMPLRTVAAKQCRHCRRDWHDPEHLRWLGEG